MSGRAHPEPLPQLAVSLSHRQGAAVALFFRAGCLRLHCGGVMERSRMALALAVAAAISLAVSACSEGPITPAPVYLMGRTTGGPARLPVAAPTPPMMQPRSPSQHQASRPVIAEKRTVVAKTHRHRVASQPPAHRRIYHAAHASGVSAAPAPPEQIPLDEPVTAPAPFAAAPSSMGASSQQPTTSWVSPPPAETPQPQSQSASP